jgi:cobalt-precorrin-5B (C1)-methyltransferase
MAKVRCSRFNPDAALAITRSDPGDNLDLTRNTPIKKKKELRELSWA